MLSFSELNRGSRIIIEKEPYEIVEIVHMVKGRGKSVQQVKLKNLKTGHLLSRTIRPAESWPEAEIKRIKLLFLYHHRGQYFFCEKDNPKNRFNLKMREGFQFLKEKEEVEGIFFNNEIINLTPPIKVSLRVIESPPGVRGDRAQSGTKIVKVETGAEINAPLFIEEGDLIEINSETGEYVRRI